MKKINIEETVKGLLRAFRRNEKQQFDSIFKRKHYHWVDNVVRQKTFEYYTTINNQMIDPVFYKENEEAFFKLIHNNWDKKTLKKSKKTSTESQDEMTAMADPNLYKEVFG